MSNTDYRDLIRKYGLKTEPSQILGREFYRRKSTVVAKELIGKILARTLGGKVLKGVIVETEAYGGSSDPASHAFRGMTRRNEVMFGEAGFTYVYFSYGFHHCLNVVTGKVGEAQAVLLRAIEPLQGIEIMRTLRGDLTKVTDLTSGPGRLCQALAIDRSLNKIDVTQTGSPVFFEESAESRRIRADHRIGIHVAQEKRWRYYDPNSPFVSHRSKINLPTKSSIHA